MEVDEGMQVGVNSNAGVARLQNVMEARSPALRLACSDVVVAVGGGGGGGGGVGASAASAAAAAAAAAAGVAALGFDFKL
jgi:Mrp family chromosome partitioning ATPase